MTYLTRRGVMRSAVAAGALAVLPKAGFAAGYPAKPITIIVPFKEGGSNDRLSRAYQPFLQEELGVPVRVENRPGAGTQLGTTFFINKPADGYTLLCTSAMPFIPNTILLQNAPYKLTDFHLMNAPSRDYTFAATSTDGRFGSIAEVIAEIKANPGTVSVAVQPSSADLVNLRLMLRDIGVASDAVRIVTYDGGNPTRTAIAGGHTDIGFVAAKGTLKLKGKVRPLVLFTDEEEAKSDWDAPLITEVMAAEGKPGEFVPGSMRALIVHSAFKENNPDDYAVLYAAIEKVAKDPAAIEAVRNSKLESAWLGEDRTMEIYKSVSERMAGYLPLMNI